MGGSGHSPHEHPGAGPPARAPSRSTTSHLHTDHRAGLSHLSLVLRVMGGLRCHRQWHDCACAARGRERCQRWSPGVWGRSPVHPGVWLALQSFVLCTNEEGNWRKMQS